jgi:hypothetical protein
MGSPGSVLLSNGTCMPLANSFTWVGDGLRSSQRGSGLQRPAYAWSTSGVSNAGSIENETNRMSADRIVRLTIVIWAVMIGHMVVHRVKMKSAIQMCPRKSDAVITCPLAPANAKAGTSHSTGGPSSGWLGVELDVDLSTRA